MGAASWAGGAAGSPTPHVFSNTWGRRRGEGREVGWAVPGLWPGLPGTDFWTRGLEGSALGSVRRGQRAPWAACLLGPCCFPQSQDCNPATPRRPPSVPRGRWAQVDPPGAPRGMSLAMVQAEFELERDAGAGQLWPAANGQDLDKGWMNPESLAPQEWALTSQQGPPQHGGGCGWGSPLAVSVRPMPAAGAQVRVLGRDRVSGPQPALLGSGGTGKL